MVAHEFSHLVLHRGLPKSLKDGAQERKLFSATLKRKSVEQQADDMTLFFLAPREIVEAMKSLAEVVNRCSVPYKLAAKARDRYAIRHFRKLEPYEVADLLIPEEEPFEEA